VRKLNPYKLKFKDFIIDATLFFMAPFRLSPLGEAILAQA